MNLKYLDEAKTLLNSVPLLINIVSRRVRQLNQGQRPLVKPDTLQMSPMDLALKEIAAKKLNAEVSDEVPQAIFQGPLDV